MGLSVKYGSPLLDKGEVLKRVSSSDILAHYTGISTGKQVIQCPSPSHKDTNPSCGIDLNKGIFRCFGCDVKGDGITYVMTRYSLRYMEALAVINNDMGLGLGATSSISPKKVVREFIEARSYSEEANSVIRVRKRKWEIKDKYFWYKKYGINIPILKLFNVNPIDFMWVNDSMINLQGKAAYSYYQGNGKYKIYQPYNKRFKWISNTKKDDIQGWNQLPKSGNLVVITKSLKDVMCYYLLGISAIAPVSESVIVSEDIIAELKERFTHIVLNYDYDYRGITSSNKMKKKYNIPTLFFTPEYGAKDLSDYIKNNGLNNTRLLIERLKNSQYELKDGNSGTSKQSP